VGEPLRTLETPDGRTIAYAVCLVTHDPASYGSRAPSTAR
jgi:hypothetical protein